jgi:RNA polymerase sigma factor (sigma-70 family)
MQQTENSMLLRRYSEDRSDEAFAELVARHIDLVYSVALRQVGDPHQAEEVAQAVFITLAKKVAQLRHDKALSSWLFQTTRLTACNFVRGETRRHRREQEAHMQSALNESRSDDWPSIAPLLDDAVAGLSEKDRMVIVLRFYEGRNLREVAAALCASEDAAQKRISRAVERLRDYFSKHGVSVGTSGLVVAVSANAVQAAPVGLAVTISTAAALTGTAVYTSSVIAATKTIAMTTLTKALIITTIAASLGTGIYESRQALVVRNQNELFLQQMAQLTAQMGQLQRERDDATNRLALISGIAEMKRNDSELLKLRGEIARLRSAGTAAVSADNPLGPEVKSLLERVHKLKQELEATPGAKIPELQFLTDADWIEATKGDLDTESDRRKAFSYLRDTGQKRFLERMQSALKKYLESHADQFPTDISQLKTYFDNPPGDEILQRYQIVPGTAGDNVITQKAVIDEEDDTLFTLGRNSLGAATFQFAEAYEVLAPAIQALNAVAPTNASGRVAFDISQLLPYLTTPEQKAAYDKLTHTAKPDSK